MWMFDCTYTYMWIVWNECMMIFIKGLMLKRSIWIRKFIWHRRSLIVGRSSSSRTHHPKCVKAHAHNTPLTQSHWERIELTHMCKLASSERRSAAISVQHRKRIWRCIVGYVSFIVYLIFLRLRSCQSHTKCHLSTKNNNKRSTKTKESKTIFTHTNVHAFACTHVHVCIEIVNHGILKDACDVDCCKWRTAKESTHQNTNEPSKRYSVCLQFCESFAYSLRFTHKSLPIRHHIYALLKPFKYICSLVAIRLGHPCVLVFLSRERKTISRVL